MLWSLTHLSMLAAGLLLAMHVQAVAFSVDSFEGIAVGKPINLTWWGDKTPATIRLLQGPPEALEARVALATNVEGDSYTWTPTTIPAGQYVLSITQSGETNYSPQFTVTSDSTPTSAAPSPEPPTDSPPAAIPAGPAPPTDAPPIATPGAVIPPPGAAYRILGSNVIAADYPPSGYNNGSRGICVPGLSANGTSAAYACASSAEFPVGHYQAYGGGVGKVDGAVSAVVVGMAFAVMLVH
ncbi:hypothetical protein BDR22DRAFT_155023 [Usnea florida]